MTIIKLSEAKAHLGAYSKRVAKGESFLISNHNRPAALLTAPGDEKKGTLPRLGLLKGKAVVPEDFDAPLPDFEKEYYGS